MPSLEALPSLSSLDWKAAAEEGTWKKHQPRGWALSRNWVEAVKDTAGRLRIEGEGLQSCSPGSGP